MAGKINLLVEKMNLISRIPTGNPSAEQWSVKVNGNLVGLVELVSVSRDGRSSYLAYIINQDGSLIKFPETFGGEFGNVHAVSAILDLVKV
jgi:hypothetical protein